MHAAVSTARYLRCAICRCAFNFSAGEAALVLRHVAYGYDFVHDGTCLIAATELLFPEPGFDCEAFYRDPERHRVLGVAPAGQWIAVAQTPSEKVLRGEPLQCWVLVEYSDGSTSMEGIIRDDEWLDEPGGAEFAKIVRRVHDAEESDIRRAA
jgi:hypothetical protein